MNCPECQSEFIPTFTVQRYCSPRCQVKANNRRCGAWRRRSERRIALLAEAMHAEAVVRAIVRSAVTRSRREDAAGPPVRRVRGAGKNRLHVFGFVSTEEVA